MPIAQLTRWRGEDKITLYQSMTKRQNNLLARFVASTLTPQSKAKTKIRNQSKWQCYHCGEIYLTIKVNNYDASTCLSCGASHLRRVGLSGSN
jgi:ribosomal protein L37AE/L43A